MMVTDRLARTILLGNSPNTRSRYIAIHVRHTRQIRVSSMCQASNLDMR